MAENEEVAISVKNVSKDFILPHLRKTSVKSVFTGVFESKKSLKKSEVQHALKNISFNINKGEFFGIVGRNGSGKSTLLKILAGIYQPSAGTVGVTGNLVPFIELGVGFNPELTGRENVYLNGALLGFDSKAIDSMYDDIVEFAELERFMDQKLKNYSSGMQVRLAFSMAIRADADILLIDEVLAVGDADFQRKCFEYFKNLKKNKKTVVFVSHDMDAVREYCDKAILIEKNEMVLSGDSESVSKAYTKMFSFTGDMSENNILDKAKRWGTQKIRYNNCKLQKTSTTIKLITEIESYEDINDAVFGFSVKSSDGVNILGSNTLIETGKTTIIKTGEIIKLSWEVPNIFNDGLHYLDLAIVYGGGVQVADWWEECMKFQIKKKNKTPYIVYPDVRLSIESDEKK